MAKLKIPKLEISDEMKERQLKLRFFLRANKGIEFKELRPIGFSISINTIPEDKVAEFLEIANSVKFQQNEVSRKALLKYKFTLAVLKI